MKLNLLSQKIQQKIVKSKTKVTKRKSYKYYNENKSQYGTPEKRNVRDHPDQDRSSRRSSAKKEIESGKSFASVAKKRSIDPTSKANGGVLEEVVKGEEEKALDEAIFSAKTGVLGGPVKTPVRLLRLRGHQHHARHPAAARAGRSRRSNSSSIATRQQKALSKFVKEFKKKWTAKTECRSGYVVADCKELQSAEDDRHQRIARLTDG